MMQITHIVIDRIRPHPLNSNVMSAAMLEKLVRHIERTGHYPPLVVRALAEIPGVYELLDGHHRCEALRRLGHAAAACVVWDVDDQGAMVLLTTLNRLHGQDDPRKRAELMQRLSEAAGDRMAELARLLPDSVERIERLMDLRRDAPAPREPRALSEMPASVHFFLTGEQRERLDARLAAIGGRREEALMRLVEGEPQRAKRN